ncbi:hypothetical protein GCM10022222_57690 [Amycolatopsis ultiminotia]|uniref:Uncharacterized protein n=1 Tax=Amycolatopsis ultiminotia TaxID=543629 RepID=A0ABP6XFE6_9PSEU
MATGSPRLLPGFGDIAGVPIPGWAGTLIAAVCILSAIVVLLVILRNRRR